MNIPLYNYAILQTDLKLQHLKAGDIILVIDYINDNLGKTKAYVVESFNALGETLSVFTLPTHLVKQFKKNQILHIRTTRVAKVAI